MRVTSLAMLATLMACSEQGLKVYNAAPVVAITTPADQQVFGEAQPISLIASVSDAENDNDELDLIWSSQGGPLAGEASIDALEARLLLRDGLPLGPHTVVLKAIDGAGASASDQVEIEVRAGAAPVLRWQAPSDGSSHAFGMPIALSAQVSDADQADLGDLLLSWGGVAAASTDAPSSPDSDGTIRWDLSGLSLGTQALALMVADADGHTDSIALQLQVVDGDLDDDGVIDQAFGGEDCDDDDASSYPGADELCDDVDNDCDGVVDEDPVDPSPWYADADNDSYGDADDVVMACDRPASRVDDDRDCDDSNNTIHPGVSEQDDGVDEDCDGDAIELTLFDGDGDGYTVGYGASGDARVDCDDSTDTTYPGASELCDALDNDCDGQIDVGGLCPCDVVERGGRPYLFCDDPSSWVDARDACYAVGYHLVTVDGGVENNWVDNEVDNYTSAEWWIGFNDRSTEGSFVWEDGSAVGYTSWHTCSPGPCQPDGDEPNNLGNEDCVELNYWTDGSWNDRDCGLLHGYVCEVD